MKPTGQVRTCRIVMGSVIFHFPCTHTHYNPLSLSLQDMFALMDLRFDEGTYKYADDVVDGQYVLLGREWASSDCPITGNKRAVHFSHDAIDHGDISHIKGVKKEASDRALVIQYFLDTWNNACLQSTNL